MDSKGLIAQMWARLDELKPELAAMSEAIWQHPEIGYTEKFASSLLADWLEKHGFTVQRGVGELDTAFVARKGAENGFKIGLCSEYDALPFGHGCGHNVFSVAAVGAAVAFAESYPDAEIRVIGCPSEEAGVTGSSGKVFLLRDGAFDGLDIAMIAHADGKTVLERRLASVCRYDITFTGKGAHSGDPHKGINAVSAGICFLSGMNALRQHFEYGTRFNAIFTESGSSANTVAERCSLRVDMRAETPEQREHLEHWVQNAAKGAAIMTDCQVEIKYPETVSECVRPNHALAESYAQGLRDLGIDYIQGDVQSYGWDMGNVGYQMPAIAPYHKIGPESIVFHTEGFKDAAHSPEAFDALVVAAKCMTRAALDYCTNEDLRDDIAAEFATYGRRG